MSSSRVEILPTSLPKQRIINWELSRNGNIWLNIFCANCGVPGGCVLENDYDFAFYLCVPCSEKLGPLPPELYAEPDTVFWDRVNQAMQEKYGRLLTVPEQIEALKDNDHILSKLVRDHRRLKKV